MQLTGQGQFPTAPGNGDVRDLFPRIACIRSFLAEADAIRLVPWDNFLLSAV